MLKPLNRNTVQIQVPYPEKIVQFGAGNFLRAFVDWMVEELNTSTNFAASVVIVKPTAHGTYDHITAQDGLFHVHLQGIRDGQLMDEIKLITCVNRVVNPYENFEAFLALARQPDVRFIVSNTTEAGIAFNPQDSIDDTPPSSFPGKLTLFLYHRYKHFHGDKKRGCIVLPCELIEQNGAQLKGFILRHAQHWGLDQGFGDWIENNNTFCNTLVDRIVTGFPVESEALLDAVGFDDGLMVEGELYHSWVIEGPAWIEKEFPAHQTDLNVQFVDDLQMYREVKVRVLNGAHTAMVPVGYLAGHETVSEVMEDELTEKFVTELLFQEVLPTLDMHSEDLNRFASDVLDRFRNPHMHHRLLTIALNSLSKFKVRLLPSLVEYVTRYGQLPGRITFAFAALIRFYKGDWQGEEIPLSDDAALVEWFAQQWAKGDIPALVDNVLANQTLWDMDLSRIDGLAEQLCYHLEALEVDPVARILSRQNW